MDGRALLVGPPGTVRDLVAGVLARSHLAVVVPTTGSEEPEADVLVLVSPGPAQWDLAGRFGAGVVLVTERHPGDAEVVKAVLAGADAVVHLDASAAELAVAVQTVRRGGTVLDPPQARCLAQVARQGSAPGELRLTPREQAILESADRGESVKQTARGLGIAPKTVENLQGRLFRKLGARNRAHAVALAHRFGLLSGARAIAS
jgi:DNA-binding NarL/FixJ family response regulator